METPLDQKTLGKLMKFCAYQDRCIAEVIDKLYKLEIWKEDHDHYINYLIDNKFLDEMRFAESYVRGKFRIKRWGKEKIKMYLKQKGIPNSFIEQAIQNAIKPEEYRQTVKDLLEQKENILRESDPFKKRQKLANYLIQKGFESKLVFSLLNED